MGNPFEKEFWVGKGPGQVRFQPYQIDPAAFSMGEGGRQLGTMLMQRARGDMPSVAEMQMKQGLGQALSSSQAMAAGATGMSPGMAMRMAGGRAGSLQSRGNLDMGMLRAKEQAGAESRLGQFLAQQRAGKMGLEQARAGQDQLMAQIAMQNAANQARGPGLGGMLLSAGGQAAAAYAGGGGGGDLGQMSQAVSDTPNAYGGYGSPSWGDKGFGAGGGSWGAGGWGGDWGQGPGGMPW